MPVKGANGVGRIVVDVVVANYGDLYQEQHGMLSAEKVRRRIVRGVIDSGATKLVLPEALVKELGLPRGDKILVRYADGRRSARRGAEGVYVELLGRHGTFTAVVEPKRENVLIGAIVLEDFDLIVDCQKQQVVPRNPDGPLYEIE